MFTVCPKCALTLVVTAADLRVAQGYVRCGRCSNVFNALARLSEDRQSASAAAQAAAPPAPAPAPTPPPGPPLDSIQAEGDDDEPIPEDALEFNPAAADVNKVFVEPPPNPEWTAATGTFKAIVLQSEEAALAAGRSIEQKTAARPPAGTAGASGIRHRAPDTQGDIELDADFLSATAAMRQLTMRGAANRAATTRPSDVDAAAELESADGHPADDRPHENNIASEADVRPAVGHSDEPLSQGEQQPRPAPQARRTATSRMVAPRMPAPSIPQQPQFAPPTKSAAQPKAPAEARVAPRSQARENATPFAFALDPPPQASATVARARVAPGELGPSDTRTPASSATLWTAGAGALVILLAAQIVNHYRNDLAANAQLNKPITALYSALGVRLTPRWDLHAYDVRQLGAAVDSAGAGQIMVRASVKNGAHQAQPMPLLRVTLQDRFGNRIAARDVSPQNYLPRAIPASSFLSAGQRIDAEMAFVDPGSNAVGFEIDACLPAPAGGTACANDSASR
ncbi:MAG: hypothetical protein JWM63_2252 [Gammaproteobacteria bacterium]|nr:hypothetical protein [Gammaproteobacteria bacterium]